MGEVNGIDGVGAVVLEGEPKKGVCASDVFDGEVTVVAVEKKPQGFSAMSLERRREIGRKGGLAAKAKGREYMAMIGKKGGLVISQNRQHMAEIGRKGGRAIINAGGREWMVELGRMGGKKASQNHQRMSEIGRKGGAALQAKIRAMRAETEATNGQSTTSENVATVEVGA